MSAGSSSIAPTETVLNGSVNQLHQKLLVSLDSLAADVNLFLNKSENLTLRRKTPLT